MSVLGADARPVSDPGNSTRGTRLRDPGVDRRKRWRGLRANAPRCAATTPRRRRRSRRTPRRVPRCDDAIGRLAGPGEPATAPVSAAQVARSRDRRCSRLAQAPGLAGTLTLSSGGPIDMIALMLAGLFALAFGKLSITSSLVLRDTYARLYGVAYWSRPSRFPPLRPCWSARCCLASSPTTARLR